MRVLWVHLHAATASAAVLLSGHALAETSTAAPTVAPVSTTHSPELRVTPPVASVSGLDTHQVSLNGTWQFMKDVPPDFDAGWADDYDWAEVTVPGHFSAEGHGRMHKEFGVPVALRRTVEVPAEWGDRRVFLRFDSVEGDTTIYVNGTEVLRCDTHYLPVEVDVSDHVTPGEAADVVLTVAKSSITQWWRPEKGGIRRDVWLMALPDVHVSSLNVTTDFDEGYDDATMRVEFELRNAGESPAEAATLALQLTDDDANTVALGDHATATLPTLAPGSITRFALDIPVDSPAHWNTDTPNLYTLSVSLDTADTGMAVQRRFGFREIEVDGNRLLVNGQSIKLKGVNFHQTWPGTDYFTPAEKLRTDMELFKAANLNYLRIWPAPDHAVMELADEMGLFMQVEVPVSMFIYRGNEANNHGDDPTYEPILHDWAEVMAEHYGSHPSALIYSLGNECWYHDFFKTTAFRLKELDPTRPIIFSGDQESGVGVEGVDINDDHYPRDGRIDFSVPGSIADAAKPDAKLSWDFPTDRPIMFSEWLHLPLGNIAEQRADPGVWDHFGVHAKAHMDHTYANEHVLGGALFTGTPVTAIHERVIIGLFDPQRRINDAFWHTVKAMTPVRIELDASGLPENPGMGVAKFHVTNRADFNDLAAYTIAYRQDPHRGGTQLVGAPGETVTMEIPVEGENTSPLEIDVTDTNGRVVDRYRFEPTNGGIRATPFPAIGDGSELALEETDQSVVVRGDDFAWTISRETGQFDSVTVGDRELPLMGPRLELTHSAHWMYGRYGRGAAVQQQLNGWKASSVTAQTRGKAVVVTVEGAFEYADVRLSYVFEADGGLTVRFNGQWNHPDPMDVFDLGVSVSLPESYDTLTWERDALWTWYPDDHIGRPVGTARAKGDPRWKQARAEHAAAVADARAEPNAHPDAYPARPWPWSQDIPEQAGGVTRDFRSTKANARHAALTDDTGAGIAVIGRGGLHARVAPDALDDGSVVHSLHANTFWTGTGELHAIKSLRLDVLELVEGSKLRGAVKFQLVPPSHDADTNNKDGLDRSAEVRQ